MRKTFEFTISKDGIRKSMSFRPEARGYSIWINNERRYDGQSFNESELATKLHFIGRQYIIEPVGKPPKWFGVKEETN